MISGRLSPRALIVFVALITLGCADDKPTTPAGTRMPDFSLQDVNSNSATTGAAVSPRAYLTRVSAWYFGHAT